MKTLGLGLFFPINAYLSIIHLQSTYADTNHMKTFKTYPFIKVWGPSFVSIFADWKATVLLEELVIMQSLVFDYILDLVLVDILFSVVCDCTFFQINVK